jgi:heme/copper-type cytochrome/quinol oxidase subunit 2
MKKTKEEIDEWKEFRKSVFENKIKSEDDYEKYITLISSGALGLSITFIEKIVSLNSALYKWILITSWILLTITLFVSLLSHFFSRKYSEKTIEDVDNDLEYELIFENITRRNKYLEYFNFSTITTLFLGIISIVIFVSININIMSDKSNTKPTQQPKPLTEEKGRTIPRPPQIKPTLKK